MTTNEIKVREIVKGIVSNHFTSLVENDLQVGNDLINRINNNLDNDIEVYFNLNSMEYNYELLEKLVDHTTDVIMSELVVS